MSVPVITPALASALGSHPSLPRHTWYLVAATTLTILNRPDEISQVYRYALEQGGRDADTAEQRRISRRLREALIKASAVGGVPKVCTYSPTSFFGRQAARLDWDTAALDQSAAIDGPGREPRLLTDPPRLSTRCYP